MSRVNSFPTILSNLITGSNDIYKQYIVKRTYKGPFYYVVAGGRGFEPLLAESESAVLPLDEPPICYR